MPRPTLAAGHADRPDDRLVVLLAGMPLFINMNFPGHR
jgi:hypothetical protein